MNSKNARRRGPSPHVLVAAAVAIFALSAVSMASAAASSVNLDQCANLTSPCSWQNGDLNSNNSAYAEGKVVPFRLAIEGLTAGTHTIHINYDFTSGGHEAYDFLATYNATETVDPCSAGGGGVSSLCPSLPAPNVQAFPSDPFTVTDGAFSASVAGAEAFSGVSRNLTMYGGTITSIVGPTHTGSTAANSTGDFLVTFSTTGSAAFFLWGGHLAQSAYWFGSVGGPADGAGEITGAPWHMRTLNLDNSGAKNQDRSIQPGALVLAVTTSSFRASYHSRLVTIRWRTSSEVNTLGFNVYRQVHGKRVRLNKRLIPSANVLHGKSTSAYSFSTRLASRRLAATSRYLLQEVHVNGTRTMYGPIRARNAA
jgi:hypothetical protein